jgi:hypothetical protein
MARLVLSVDDRVASGAKQYAKSRGVSISEMVGAYLAAVAVTILCLRVTARFCVPSEEFSRRQASRITVGI